jgi:hypothetical protein
MPMTRNSKEIGAVLPVICCFDPVVARRVFGFRMVDENTHVDALVENKHELRGGEAQPCDWSVVPCL